MNKRHRFLTMARIRIWTLSLFLTPYPSTALNAQDLLIRPTGPVSSATREKDYLARFQQFMEWSVNLPTHPTPEFIQFIHQSKPLSQKLRERWLYHLASMKDWAGFLHDYQPSNDINLQCYRQWARINQGLSQRALPVAKALWLHNKEQPSSCNPLFTWLLKTHDPQQHLITQRIRLALENRNITLATYLLNQYSPAHTVDLKTLQAIHQKPSRIINLTPGQLHDDFYLYGLKRMIAKNIDEAVHYWKAPKARLLLNEQQNQAFLNELVIYKAMRNSNDTTLWFNKIKREYYTNTLLDWQIRFALKHQQWRQVATLIQHSKAKNEPCWQYWLARAWEAQGKTTAAHAIYEPLSKIRHYYGFLASLRLKTKLTFDNQPVHYQVGRLNVYQPIIDKLKALYFSHQIQQASRLVNDFASELPLDDKTVLVQWIQDSLNWHGKAFYLSASNDLSNHLSLRFPLVHRQDVAKTAQHFQVQPALIYAVIRQESSFREDVTSSAGAQGLMQLMPDTALKIARAQKIAYTNKSQLFSCIKNITLGTAYLQQLDKRFHHNPVLMAAAYNAGPTQANYWLKNHPPKQIDIWIETLPWQETRNYLKNIIAFYAVYQYRINGRSDLTWLMKGF